MNGIQNSIHRAGTKGAADRGQWRYAAAVLPVAASIVLWYLLRPWLASSVPYLQFFPAIFIASWYGGLGPGALATALAALALVGIVLPPDALTNDSWLISLGLFVGTGLGIAWLNGERRSAALKYRDDALVAEARAERLDAIIRTSVDGIVVIDSRGVVEAFNPGAERLFGYRAAEVLGRNVNMLMPSPYREEHDGYIERYLRTGEARIIGLGREVAGQRKDGSTFPAHLSVSEMAIGGQRKFTGMVHDLTERMRLESELRASEARWRAVIESAVDGIVVIDARGVVEAFNPAAERLFGYGEHEVIGQNVNILMPSPYREEHDGYLARYLRTREAHIIGHGREVSGRRKDGTVFPIHLSVGELTVGGATKFTGIIHDLSARVRMEERLREQTALARLGEMAAVIAHEVKNPLAAIRGAIQVIGGRLPKDSRDAAVAKEVVSRIDGLNDLMKDLLLFSRPPQPHPSPVDVASLVGETAALLAGDPAASGVRVVVSGSAPEVQADAELLKIVFLNLLINGAQAMHGQGSIDVTVGSVDGTCHITIRDGGPGIPSDVRERIFTPFFTTKARGTGLGLPTARRLVEAHGGTIDIECPPGGGTAVTITLPTS